MHVTAMDCCGIRELAGVGQGPSDKKAFLGELHARMYTSGGPYPSTNGTFGCRFAHLIFSEAGDSTSYARRLKEAIEFYKLGTVLASPNVVNPNSGNKLRAFLWTVDHDAFYKWNPKEAPDLPTLSPLKTRKAKAAPRVNP